MKILLLFVLTSAGGGLGKIAGLLAGSRLMPGIGIVLQFVVGTLVFAASVLLAERLGAVKRHQRTWTMVGGIIGVGMSTLVTLSTLSSPVAPYVVPSLIGMGAALGSFIGRSAHERPDLT